MYSIKHLFQMAHSKARKLLQCEGPTPEDGPHDLIQVPDPDGNVVGASRYCNLRIHSGSQC